MNRLDEHFLSLLRCALTGEIPEKMEDLSPNDWQQLLAQAEQQHVLPLIYEAARRIPAVNNGTIPAFAIARQKVFHQVMVQTVKTSEFLQLNRYLHSAGIRPLVVKGIICRNLYPKPDHRPSGDEDVLIPVNQYGQCHNALVDFGMEQSSPGEKADSSYEVPYLKTGSSLYMELHKSLFPPESTAYGSWTRFFDGVFDRAVCETIDGVPVWTLEYSDHFFYLICHAFKHFLHSGFGIRQVCDIVLYANKYGKYIDWFGVLKHCREIRAEKFTAALLKIGEKHLVFDPEAACYPAFWQEIQADETPMLEDLLTGGIYGGATMSRKHSSTMTLDAMAASNRGQKAKPSVVGSLFPPAKHMTKRYYYLRDKPWLLPLAWAQRIAKYGLEVRKAKNSSAAEALKIGSRRIALMREYGIIE